jgi:hypothetical protein
MTAMFVFHNVNVRSYADALRFEQVWSVVMALSSYFELDEVTREMRNSHNLSLLVPFTGIRLGMQHA